MNTHNRPPSHEAMTSEEICQQLLTAIQSHMQVWRLSMGVPEGDAEAQYTLPASSGGSHRRVVLSSQNSASLDMLVWSESNPQTAVHHALLDGELRSVYRPHTDTEVVANDDIDDVCARLGFIANTMFDIRLLTPDDQSST